MTDGSARENEDMSHPPSLRHASLTIVRHGSLLESGCAAFVNPVNTVGIMGKGLAWEFKTRWPEMFQDYVSYCRAGKLQPGSLHVWPFRGHDQWIVNLPTKRHWRDPSRLADVTAGVDALVTWARQAQPVSLAIPALGCGLGGLPWDAVQAMMMERLMPIADQINIQIYAPR